MQTDKTEAGNAQNEASASAFLTRARKGQELSLSELSRIAVGAKVPLVKVPYFDMEAKSVYGLRYFGTSIMGSS